MEVFRYSRNVYGQEILEGVSFDLIWIFAGFSAAVICAHLLLMLLKQRANTK